MFTPAEYITLVATTSQVLFYVIIGTVTILTYRRARATILQPIRTEIFKAQVELLKELLHHFVGKGTVELLRDFGIEKTEYGNIMKMAGAYARIMFDHEPRGRPPWEGPDFPMVRTTMRACEAMGFELITKEPRSESHPQPVREPPTPAVRACLWEQYIHDDLALSDIYCDKLKKLQNLLESPLMPRDCAKKLTEFLEALDRNVTAIGTGLTSARSEFPNNYQSLGELDRPTFAWLHNKCSDHCEDLKPRADAIVSVIRQYFSPDALARVDWPK